jgi:kynurenine formamidase
MMADNPFTDAVRSCQFTQQCGPPDGVPADLPFTIHHNNLTNGIYQIQNGNTAELARDKVSLSCVMILPLQIKGGSGSAVRPIAIGTPRENY